ncbi:MAG: heme o synthase [Actinomycetes bacterium]
MLSANPVVPPVGVAAAPAQRTPAALARGLVALTKPRIIELLLVTTVPTMLLAKRGFPGFGVLMATLVGGTLAAGSANTLNCYLDRDIDVVMHRTERRPLATGVIRPGEALLSGIVLAVLSTVLLGLTVNWLAAGLALGAIAFYVFGYTIGLKRHTTQNIVWGGAAGCMPVLIGWAAVTDRLSWAPLVLFAVIFFWTPPHFWALAMRFREDYAAAEVPMLPVVASQETVTRRIVLYSYAMVGASLALWPVASTSWVYPAAAGVVGVAFLAEAHRLDRAARRGGVVDPMRLFRLSISYLTVLFAAVAVAALI